MDATDLPVLTGTPKQVAYADRIRRALLPEIEALSADESGLHEVFAGCVGEIFEDRNRLPCQPFVIVGGTPDGGLDVWSKVDWPEEGEINPAWVQAARGALGKVRSWLNKETRSGMILDRLTAIGPRKNPLSHVEPAIFTVARDVAYLQNNAA